MDELDSEKWRGFLNRFEEEKYGKSFLLIYCDS